jgi:hypothetical protein
VHQSVYRPGVKLLFKKKKKHQSKNWRGSSTKSWNAVVA